jgi:hypothetical protein
MNSRGLVEFVIINRIDILITDSGIDNETKLEGRNWGLTSLSLEKEKSCSLIFLIYKGRSLIEMVV